MDILGRMQRSWPTIHSAIILVNNPSAIVLCACTCNVISPTSIRTLLVRMEPFHCSVTGDSACRVHPPEHNKAVATLDILNKLDTLINVIRNPQTVSSTVTTLGSVQPTPHSVQVSKDRRCLST